MPLRQTVILTVLPNGWKDGDSTSGVLQATVVVSLQASPPKPVMLHAAVPLLRNWADPAYWTGADALSFGL